MCEHEEALDCGEYVCVKCGIVIGQEYVSNERSANISKNDLRNPELYIDICNILDTLNLNIFCYVEEVYNLIDNYLSNLKSKNEFKIGAAIFFTPNLIIIFPTKISLKFKNLATKLIKFTMHCVHLPCSCHAFTMHCNEAQCI